MTHISKEREHPEQKEAEIGDDYDKEEEPLGVWWQED